MRHSVVNPFEYHNIDFTLKPHAGRWEGGAPNVPGLWALGASLDLLLGAGIPNVAARVLELTDYLCERVTSVGCEVFSSRTGSDRSGVVSFTKPGHDQKELVKRCRAAGVVINCRADRLRASPHCYNTEAEVDRLVDLL